MILTLPLMTATLSCLTLTLHTYASHLFKVSLQLLNDALQLDLEHIVLLTVAVAHLQDKNTTASQTIQ